MIPFKFLDNNDNGIIDNNDNGIIGAFYEEDLSVQLTTIDGERTFTFPLNMWRSLLNTAYRMFRHPEPIDIREIVHQGLFSYEVTDVQETTDGRLSIYATIRFNTEAGVLCYYINKTMPLL